MYIFHIPTGFPSRHSSISGNSAKDYIHLFAENYPDSRHTVSLHYETSYLMLLKKGKFLTELPKFLWREKRIDDIKIKENLNYCYAKKSIVFSTKLGFSEKLTWYKRHKENFEYILKKYGKPDIIHAQFTRFGGWTAMMLSKEFSIPYIITERFGPFPHKSFLDEKANILFEDIYLPMKNANILVSVSESHANDIRKYVDRDVQVINNFIDEDLFIPASNNTSIADFTFLTITSSYQSNKGIEDLIRAIKILREKGVKAKFKIGGGPSDKDLQRLRKVSRELAIDDQIKWFGKLTREEVASMLQSCSCFISPSRYESFGLACAEAIACGKPVIATKSGGPQSIVNDLNGLLVETQNPKIMADSMYYMLHNIQKYSSFQIREDFIKRFSAKSIIKQYNDLYKAVINK